jgi:hypothetical protein
MIYSPIHIVISNIKEEFIQYCVSVTIAILDTARIQDVSIDKESE